MSESRFEGGTGFELIKPGLHSRCRKNRRLVACIPQSCSGMASVAARIPTNRFSRCLRVYAVANGSDSRQLGKQGDQVSCKFPREIAKSVNQWLVMATLGRAYYNFQ